MLVRFVGFSIEVPDSLPLSELMASMASDYANFESADDIGRFMFIDDTSNDDYYLGLVVTVKNQRTFCELKENSGAFKIQVNSLEDDSRIMDFNFFVINKASGVGLYQHYHQSCSIGQAMRSMKKKFLRLKEVRKEAKKVEVLESGKSEGAATKAAGRQYKGTFKWQVLISRESLPSLLSEMEKIKSLEFDFAYLEPEARYFSQLSGYVRKQRKKFSFSTSAPFSGVLEAVVSSVEQAIGQDEAEQGKVFATDGDGIDRIIRIQNQPDNFGEYDYDELASHISELEVSDFASSWVTEKLIEICIEHDEIFEASIR
ncbi:hypothetical protein SAMN05216361_0033 [Marisediminitalea aggregata]|uniref:Uncharacterized protein n=1 Tax=Marisediminitalea aggregata TaxID=634436 RepID=A0A1M5SMH6_9ALTE|nr:hypothetical protein [Marisediminitalea aggregata]SHH39732.1 hypothetical protein SAMN05216361_0033 [Marisediminitalea aggregata]